MGLTIPIGNTAEQSNGTTIFDAVGFNAGGNAQGGAVYPPYLVEAKIEGGIVYWKDLEHATTPETNPKPEDIYQNVPPNWNVFQGAKTLDPVYEKWGDGNVYPPRTPPANETSGGVTNGNDTPADNNSIPGSGDVPLDPRLVFLVDGVGNSVIYSFTSKPELQAALIDGFTVKDPATKKLISATSELSTKDAAIFTEFYGVPSLMNYNAYINFQAAGGKAGNKYLIDRENQPRFYDVTADGTNSNNVSTMGELTVKGLVGWSEKPTNIKFPYKYQDFVFLKWWKKIPLNYMITLRRYTSPVIDSVGSSDEAAGNLKPEQLIPAATAITFLGEDTGNKISTILGPIDAGLKWKDIKAEVWEVNFSGSPAKANNPIGGGAAKLMGFLTKGAGGAKESEDPGAPPDPYKDGPYSNKIIGPINVIDSTKARDKGISFKHDISLIFEYSARSIGGVNSKAAMLDILGNLMILTFNEATFWGGQNRYMPQGQGGDLDPFLGGEAGRSAWLKGDAEGFFKSLGEQFSAAASNIGDAFNKFMDDPISGLKSLASGGMTEFMKYNTTGGKGFMQGIHSLLTGNPVGEWHLTVGNPMNPMMMIGNLICMGIKIEFGDELGPDDFPTELKATVQLEHGMFRDRAGIESMFNKGRGRLYSLPKGYEDGFSTHNQSSMDTSTGKDLGVNAWGEGPGRTKGTASKGSARGSGNSSRAAIKNPLLGDPAVIDNIFGYYKQSVVPRLKSTAVGVYSHGVKAIKKAVT
jgi:hypothetical protein